MSKLARFGAYAAAFEKSYQSDDWSWVEPFFTENAVYDAGVDLFMGGHFEGRAAILAYFKAVLDGFDRRFESREIALLDGPFEEEQTVRFRGSASYRAEGVPDLVLVLEEIITFEGDRIIHLEDRYDDDMIGALRAYLEEHGEALELAIAG
ncbi:MAG: nuclear transport factor 2 family protein [Deltaproteobacteria bacterium]|nr:nuclear transport factor 2 family protein [Deltaproteobacteria bacterium]MBW2400642.1 nuclear transport factor 2 family protein [Deltaproteobacteria bacterium]